jgi:hypothetical protein
MTARQAGSQSQRKHVTSAQPAMHAQAAAHQAAGAAANSEGFSFTVKFDLRPSNVLTSDAIESWLLHLIEDAVHANLNLAANVAGYGVEATHVVEEAHVIDEEV